MFHRESQNIPARDKAKTKIPSKTIFSKIKTHLKLSSKSVGQGRGGLEGTVRPSPLRTGSPPKKKIAKKKPSRTQCGDLLAMRLLHPVGVRNDKNREQELCGKCVRDGSGLAIRTRGIIPFFGFWERG